MAGSAAVLVKPISGSHDLSIFDVSTRNLRQISLSMARSFPEDYGITFLSDPGTFMLAGGCASGTYAMLPHCYLVNVVEETVREVARLPVALKGLRLLYDDGNVYCIGGCAEGREHIETQRTCYVYSSRHDVWLRVADLLQAVVFPGVLFKDGEIWVTGGYFRGDEGSHVLDMVQVYSVVRNEWRVGTASLLRPSYLHGCVLLPDRRVLVLCGLRDTNSNRFSYCFGTEKRAVLPEKISMSVVDPPVLRGDTVFVFNDEMSLLMYDWRTEGWTVVIDPETMSE